MKKFIKFLLRKTKPKNAPSASRSRKRPRQFLVQKVKPQNALSASRLVTEYRENGLGSNRADWERMTALLAAVETAIDTNSAVDITTLFPADANGKQYHTAHRALNAGIIRPFRHKVTVVVLSNAKTTGRTVAGESTTTGKGKVFVVPVIGDAKVPALV
jgi:hypothetical protein